MRSGLVYVMLFARAVDSRGLAAFRGTVAADSSHLLGRLVSDKLLTQRASRVAAGLPALGCRLGRRRLARNDGRTDCHKHAHACKCHQAGLPVSRARLLAGGLLAAAHSRRRGLAGGPWRQRRRQAAGPHRGLQGAGLAQHDFWCSGEV